jgi:replicative superfamily II helicase
VGVLALVLGGVVETIVAGQEAAASAADHVRRLESILDAVHESTRRLADLSQLSDAAKSLLFREQEVHAMEELLHDELIRQEYDKAEALVREVEQRFGHAEQAQRMRRLIQLAREGSIEQRVESAVARIEALLEAHDWTRATNSIRRLMRLLPDNPRIAQLPRRVRAAKVEHKRQLLQGYGEAVGKGDIDRSIELLRELDKYLTPQEAAALEESARDVFRAKLHNLGVQFAIRVTDEAWSEAVEIGQQIVREYPNSRMAQEVRMKMDTLRALAAGTERGTGQ